MEPKNKKDLTTGGRLKKVLEFLMSDSDLPEVFRPMPVEEDPIDQPDDDYERGYNACLEVVTPHYIKMRDRVLKAEAQRNRLADQLRKTEAHVKELCQTFNIHLPHATLADNADAFDSLDKEA